MEELYSLSFILGKKIRLKNQYYVLVYWIHHLNDKIKKNGEILYEKYGLKYRIVPDYVNIGGKWLFIVKSNNRKPLEKYKYELNKLIGGLNNQIHIKNEVSNEY